VGIQVAIFVVPRRQLITSYLHAPLPKLFGVMTMCFHQICRPGCYELGLAAICWAIWKARNMLCFEKKLINSPFEIILSDCAFIHDWAVLYPGDAQKVIEDGVELLSEEPLLKL
jgi:hypothetical protein